MTFEAILQKYTSVDRTHGITITIIMVNGIHHLLHACVKYSGSKIFADDVVPFGNAMPKARLWLTIYQSTISTTTDFYTF